MAPALQGLCSEMARWSGAVLCPACECGVLKPLALMDSADRVPFCFAGCLALDMYRGVPIPGLTGSPSPLIVLALVEWLGVFEGSVFHAAASRVAGCGPP